MVLLDKNLLLPYCVVFVCEGCPELMNFSEAKNE